MGAFIDELKEFIVAKASGLDASYEVEFKFNSVNRNEFEKLKQACDGLKDGNELFKNSELSTSVSRYSQTRSYVSFTPILTSIRGFGRML